MVKHLQILRNQTISSDRNSAKSALLAQLATLNDGEIAINRYQDGTQVKVLIGFNNTIGTDTKAYVFDADGVPADVQAALDTLNGDETTEGSVKKAIKDAVEVLDVDAIGGKGKVITTVSEEDGKISAVAEDLTSSIVARTATEATDDKVAVDGTNTEDAIASLATSIMEAKKSAATYSVAKVTEGLASNVREAYQLVQTVNSTSTNVGEKILIYNDSSLKSVDLVDEKPATDTEAAVKGQFLKFTYILEDGSDNIVYLDCSKFLVESEFKNGLEVSTEGEVSVKIDTTSEGAESFLSVSEGGVKVSGVQDAIDDTVDAAKKELIGDAADDYNTMGKLEDKIQEVDKKASAAHTKVNAKADGYVTVAVEAKTTADGVSYSEVTVSENDIASAQDLADEITRAKAAEDKIEASVGLAEDGSHKATTGNYTSAATTVVGEIAALDAQVKANSDAIDVLNDDDTVTGSVKKTVKDAVEALDVAAIGGTGKYITTVSETNGKIDAVAEDLTATATAFTAIAAADDTVAVTGANVQEAIASLAKDVNALTWIEA
jgi:hypothetical protein